MSVRKPAVKRSPAAASLAALVAGCAIALSASATADAYVIGGDPWPTATVTYYTAARGYSGAVDRAARVLNSVGLRVQLRRVSRASARVVVAYGGRRCDGRAYVGFLREGADVLTLGRGCSRGVVTLTAVHEFAHVLGLDHEERRCARMNPTFDGAGTPTRCAHRPLSYWLAHPLLGDDLAGLRALYPR